MPLDIEDTASPFFPRPVAHLALRLPLDVDDSPGLTQAMSASELRVLAAHWRASCQADGDTQRTERVARVLEWLAERREPPPRSRLEVLGERVSGWMGL